ncbi:MAG: hypothetical protein K0U74_15395 [Alphaproteobacteria bacterium]|nr:hypothetical protein [Alphaproteobacteria bacterium]
MPDTIQWWIAPLGNWRIRTFALDHDIHTHAVGHADNLVELALTNTEKNYFDVIHSQHVIEISDCRDEQSISASFRRAGLEARFEFAEGRFVFWKPDDERYYTQSVPN